MSISVEGFQRPGRWIGGKSRSYSLCQMSGSSPRSWSLPPSRNTFSVRLRTSSKPLFNFGSFSGKACFVASSRACAACQSVNVSLFPVAFGVAHKRECLESL